MTADISNNDLAVFSYKNSSLLSNINRETALAYESDLDVGNRVTGHCISLVRNSLEVFLGRPDAKERVRDPYSIKNTDENTIRRVIYNVSKKC